MILHPAHAAGPGAGEDLGTGLVGTLLQLFLGFVTATQELLGTAVFALQWSGFNPSALSLRSCLPCVSNISVKKETSVSPPRFLFAETLLGTCINLAQK